MKRHRLIFEFLQPRTTFSHGISCTVTKWFSNFFIEYWSNKLKGMLPKTTASTNSMSTSSCCCCDMDDDGQEVRSGEWLGWSIRSGWNVWTLHWLALDTLVLMLALDALVLRLGLDTVELWQRLLRLKTEILVVSLPSAGCIGDLLMIAHRCRCYCNWRLRLDRFDGDWHDEEWSSGVC